MKINELKAISENLIDTFHIAGKESIDLYASGLKIEIKMNINDKWKKILFAAFIIIAIELSGFGIFASFFRLLGSVST